jgi:hypothetical protein
MTNLGATAVSAGGPTTDSSVGRVSIQSELK